MKLAMVPTILLTLLLVCTPSRADNDEPLSKRQQFYVQTAQQLAFCTGLTRAYRQQLDEEQLGRRKHASLSATAAADLDVFSYATDVVADRRSIPVIWKNGDALQDLKLEAEESAQKYEQSVVAEIAKGVDISRPRSDCSKFAKTMSEKMAKPPHALDMSKKQESELGVHLRNVQLVARCAAITHKAGEDGLADVGLLQRQFQRHINLMNTRYIYYLAKLWPEGNREKFEGYLGPQATPHYSEMLFYWDEIGEEHRAELLVDCRQYDRFIEARYQNKQ